MTEVLIYGRVMRVQLTTRHALQVVKGVVVIIMRTNIGTRVERVRNPAQCTDDVWRACACAIPVLLDLAAVKASWWWHPAIS